MKKEITETEELSTRGISKKSHLPVLVLFLLVATSSLALYFGYRLIRAVPTTESVAQNQIPDLVLKVGKLIVLPANEIPTLATVTDLDKLKDQPFFANAQVGDKVLIYVKAGKAILYNPTLNKIVDISPLAPNSVSADSGSGIPTQKKTTN